MRGLHVIAELENGWNSVASVEGTAGDQVNGPAAVIDGNISTYFALTSANVLDLKAERLFQADTVRLNLWSASGVLSGKVTMQYLEGGQWKNFNAGGVADLSTFHEGWNDIKLPSKVTTISIRLTFEVPSDKRRPGAAIGGVSEARLIGSPVGARPARGLVVTFPLAGEFSAGPLSSRVLSIP